MASLEARSEPSPRRNIAKANYHNSALSLASNISQTSSSILAHGCCSHRDSAYHVRRPSPAMTQEHGSPTRASNIIQNLDITILQLALRHAQVGPTSSKYGSGMQDRAEKLPRRTPPASLFSPLLLHQCSFTWANGATARSNG